MFYLTSPKNAFGDSRSHEFRDWLVIENADGKRVQVAVPVVGAARRAWGLFSEHGFRTTVLGQDGTTGGRDTMAELEWAMNYATDMVHKHVTPRRALAGALGVVALVLICGCGGGGSDAPPQGGKAPKGKATAGAKTKGAAPASGTKTKGTKAKKAKSKKDD